MSSQDILTSIEGHVGILTVNRPKVHNALSDDVLRQFEAAFIDFESNDQVRVIIITGAGERSFVAGGDLSEMNKRAGLAHYQEFGEDVHRVFRRIEVSDKPTIAAVNGYALGGGTELLLCTDIRLAADTAQLALPEIGLGVFPGAGGTQRAIRQLSPCQAREIMFTGDWFSAQRAVEMGLVNRVVSQADLMHETMAIAERIASKSPLVVKLLKRTLRDGADMPMGAALAHEQAMIGLVFDTGDAHEGITAFLEKRKASFTGR
jgi:enoyl-CoA hydratase